MTIRSHLLASAKGRASRKATASPFKTVIFVRCHFVWARINCPRESLTQHAKDVIWLRSWNAASTLHFNYDSFNFSQTCTLFYPCCTTDGERCLWTSCHCCHASSAVLPMLVEVWWASFQMTSLCAAQICQWSKAIRSAISRLSGRHISKTKFAKLLTVPTHGCSTVESPAQYQISCATIQPTKASQSSSTFVSHLGHINSHCTCRDCNRRCVRTHSLQILHNKLRALRRLFKYVI